ncbi:MAG TPA: hypothetical protein VLM05_08790, partial [Mycobacteriales bacterium]|nr:hypothetical protein [Mycobacteriales bacterium]
MEILRRRAGRDRSPSRPPGSAGSATVSPVRTPTTLLALLAAAVLALGPLDLHQHYGLGPAAALGLSALRAAPLALARSRPLAAWAGVLAATVLTAAVPHPVSASEPWPWAVTSVLA